MNRLFWGLIFVLLDWKITLGTANIGLLPDVLGFYLLMKGMDSLASGSGTFGKGRHLAFALAILSGILYGADLMNPQTGTKVLLWFLGLGCLIGMFLLLRMLIRGLEEMGFETRNLSGMWLVLMMLQSICYLANWIPLVGSICNVAALGIGVLFLTIFRKTVKDRK